MKNPTSEGIEIQLIKTTVTLKKVNITVRFPCSISFALKYETNVVEHQDIHELRNGQCIIGQSIEMELQIPYHNGKYDEKKMSLLIFMISVNGKIPAGSVTINPTDRVMNDKKVTLQKCPDKNAQVIFTLNFEKVKLVKMKSDFGRKGVTHVAVSPAVDKNHQSNLSVNRIKHSGSSGLFKSQVQGVCKDSSREESQRFDANKLRMHSSRVVQAPHQRQRFSLTTSQYEIIARSPQSPANIARQKSAIHRLQRQTSDFHGSRASNHIEESQQAQQLHQKKISILERQNEGYIKQISKMKNSVRDIDSQQRYEQNNQIQDELNKIIGKQKAEEQKISEKVSDRGKDQKERESESSSQRRDLREDLNKKKSRVIALDSSRSQYEVRLAEKDRLISQLQNDKIKLEQLLQQEKSLQLSGQKRQDVKESSYRQQLKKLNDKFSQSEIERQKALFDYNNLQSQVQTSEKKNQLTLRQKQRNLIQQRNKLTKKLQQVNLDYNSLKQAQEETKALIAEYQSAKKKTIDQFKSKQLRINELVQANKTLQSDMKSLEATNKVLKEEVEHVSSQFSEDKGNFKKKYMETTNQLNIQKDKFQKLKVINLNLEVKNRQLSQKLEKQTKEKNTFSAKLEQTKKNQQKYIQQEENKQRAVESLSSQSFTQNQRLTELKNKLQSEKKKYEQMQKKYEEKDQYFQQSKEQMQTEIDQLKWQIKTQAQKFQILSSKNRDLNEQMIDQSRKVIDMQTKVAEDEQTFHQKDSKILELQQQIEELHLNLQQANENIKRIEGLNHTIQKKEQEILILQQALDKNNQNFTSQIETLLKTIEEHQNQIRNKNQSIIAMHDQIDIKKEEIYKLTQNLNARINELTIAKDLSKTLSQDYTAISEKFAKINEEQKSKAQRLQYLQENLSQKTSQLSSNVKQLELITSEFQQYKFTLKQTLEQLIQQVNRDQSEKRQAINVIAFKPDSQLQFLLTDCLKKHQLRVGKSEQKFLEQMNTVAYLQEQLFKQQAFIQKIGEEHDERLRKQDEKLKLIIDSKNKEISDLKMQLEEEMQKLSDFASQVDYLNSEINKLEYTIDELNRQIVIHQENQNELRQLSSEMEIQIFNFKEKDYKEKALNQTEQEEIKRGYETEIEKKKETIRGLGEEIKLKDKTISEKSDQIKRITLNEEHNKAQKLKLAQQLKEITAKCNQQANYRIIAEKQLKEREKSIKDLQEQLQSSKKAIDESKTKELIQGEEIKKVKGDLSLQEDRYKILKEDQELRYVNLFESEKREREKIDRLEITKAKLEQQNLQLREKYMKLESEIEFYKFYKAENTKRIEQFEKMKEESMAQLYRQKQNAFKSEKEISNYQTKFFKLEAELQNSNREKASLVENIQMCKQKIAELEEAKKKIENDYENEMNEMQYKVEDYDKLRDALASNEQQNQKTINQLKTKLNQARQQLHTRGTLIEELEKLLEDRPCDINVQKAKWEADLENERHQLQIKMSKIEQNFMVLQQELEFQKQQSIKEIEGANSVIQELNEVVRDKEESLQYKEEVINEQTIQLQEMNLQLNQCISKWEKEKEAYLPTATKMNELNDQIARMNKFIIELDGRNKQLLEINKRKMQQKIQNNKSSITDMLKEILLLVQKNKNKLLGRCINDKEKEQVILQFKTLQDKLDMTLKSTQIVTIAAPKKQ